MASRATRRPHDLLLAIGVCVSLLLTSCTYSFSGASVPSHINTIAVSTFRNDTLQPSLDQDVTNALIDLFANDSRLNLGTPGQSDAVVEGTITRYDHSVFGLSGTGDSSLGAQAEEYRVTLQAAVTVKDRVKGKDLWRKDSMVVWSNYRIDGSGDGPTNETEARAEAIDKLIEDILSNTLEDW